MATILRFPSVFLFDTITDDAQPNGRRIGIGDRDGSLASWPLCIKRSHINMMYDPGPGGNPPTPTISYRIGHLMAVELPFEDATVLPLKRTFKFSTAHANFNQSTPLLPSPGA